MIEIAEGAVAGATLAAAAIAAGVAIAARRTLKRIELKLDAVNRAAAAGRIDLIPPPSALARSRFSAGSVTIGSR